jgi:uncharacterized protein
LLYDMSKLFPNVRVRELSDMQRHLRAPSGASVSRACNQPGAVVNIDVTGNVTTFSPELLGLTYPGYGRFSWMNVANAFPDASATERYHRVANDVAKGVELCHTTCPYFNLCGGGDPSNKLAELGTLVSTETLHCKLHIRLLADVVMSRLEQELDADKCSALQGRAT